VPKRAVERGDPRYVDKRDGDRLQMHLVRQALDRKYGESSVADGVDDAFPSF
jgi:hypothetical protein